MSVAKTLREAAEYIRVHGWTQGANEDAAGRVSMRGACAAVVTGSAFGWGVPNCVFDAIDEVTAGQSVADFNDLFCQSANDAIAALEIAADKESMG